MVRTVEVSGSGSLDVTVECFPGEVAMGGGGSDDSGKSLTRSLPANGGVAAKTGEKANGWTVKTGNGGQTSKLQAYVVCIQDVTAE